MKFWKRNLIPLILTAAAALTGMCLAGVSMYHGPGVGGDATIYLTTAENLAKGFGLVLLEPDGSTRLLPFCCLNQVEARGCCPIFRHFIQ